MSIVTINLAEREFKLGCSEESKPHILKLAQKLDLELNEMSKGNPSASFEMLLVMTSLSLMDEKHSKAKESGGEALAKAERDHQKQLTSVFYELKTLADKF